METGLRPLGLADVNRAVLVESRAFQNDPLWEYIIPDAAERARWMPRFYEVFMRTWAASGQLYGVGDSLEGIAVWSKPGQKDLEFGRLVGNGFLKLVFSPFLVQFIRAGRIFSRFEAMQKQYAPEPHYYLNTIAVLPEAQGKGLASQLIKPFLAKADAEGVSVYTETMTPANVGLYEHYGFQVMEQYRVPQTDLSIWSFYRAVQK